MVPSRFSNNNLSDGGVMTINQYEQYIQEKAGMTGSGICCWIGCTATVTIFLVTGRSMATIFGLEMSQTKSGI